MSPSLESVDLRCDNAAEPLGIDTPQPRFSWRAQSPARGAHQTAYRVVVGEDADEVASGDGSLWDSGVVASPKSNGIVYSGGPLSSRTRYFWSVSVRDGEGEWAEFAAPASFETAFLDPSEWGAQWIGCADVLARPISPLFRTEFDIAKPIASARAYVTGLGYFELHINGEKVGDNVLDPGWTDTQERVLYVTHDVTDLLVVGRNAVGAILGIGRFENPQQSRWGSQTQLLLELRVTHTDGEETTVRSDGKSGWVTTPDSPIINNNIYDGETYDARAEISGWSSPGFTPNLNIWRPAYVVEPPRGRLVAQALEPIKVIDELRAVDIKEVSPGVFVFDLGQNFAGWARLRTSGAAGTSVTMRFAEMVNDDGTVNQTNLRHAASVDTYILSGQGVETYEPRFTYHGFRFVQVEGLPAAPDQETIVGRVVRSSVSQTGRFSTSNRFINQLHRAIVWTESSNLHSLPTDCPQRDERLGWLNDMTVRAHEAVYNFDVARLYAKWIDDIADAQGSTTGAITDTAPYAKFGGRPADPVSASFLLVPWLNYQHFGDERTFEEHYPDLVAWFRYLQNVAPDDLVELSHFGDWAPPMTESAGEDTIGAGAVAAHTPGELISSGFYRYNAILLARFAGILGKTDEQAEFEQMAERIRAAIQAKCFDKETGNFGTGNQACNAFALYMDLVPEGHVEAVLGNLVEDIIRHDYHITTGNLVTKYMIDVLTDYGRGDVAWQLVTQRTYPSWGYMLDHGATTIWERWEWVTGGPIAEMGSHNHPMYGAIDAWFYKYVAGISVAESGVAFSEFIVKPHLLGDLDDVDCELDTVRGLVSVHWSISDDVVRLDVTIPANTSATIYVPTVGLSSTISESGTQVWLNGAERDSVDGLSAGAEDQDWVAFAAKAGSYSFTSSGASAA